MAKTAEDSPDLLPRICLHWLLRLAICNLLGSWGYLNWLLNHLICLLVVTVLAFAEKVVLSLLLRLTNCQLLISNLRVNRSSYAKTAKLGILTCFRDVCTETCCVLSVVGDFLHGVELLVVFMDCVCVENVLFLVARGHGRFWSRFARITVISTVG